MTLRARITLTALSVILAALFVSGFYGYGERQYTDEFDSTHFPTALPRISC